MRNVALGALALLTLPAAASQAADLPRKAPPKVVPVYSWEGAYIGGNVGYSWGRSETDVSYFTFPGGVPIVPPAGSVTSATAKLEGWIAGGQIGYNWQRNQWVFGLEADIQWSDQRGPSNFLCAGTAVGGPCLPGLTFLPPGVTGSTLALDQHLEWFGTVRARLGWTPTPTSLLYVTGGLAYGEVSTNGLLTGFNGNGFAVASAGNHSDTLVGWTIGVGLEGVISGRWTGKIEYLYMDLGSTSGTFVSAVPLVPVQARYTSDITDHILRVGLNYRFHP